MKISDIENMGAAEIKEARADIAEALKDAPDLIPRYIATLIDAKTRDEKLAEQGRTITMLQEAAGASKEKVAAIEDSAERLAKEVARIAGELADANERCADLAAVADLAKRRRVVLAEISGLIAPLLVEE